MRAGRLRQDARTCALTGIAIPFPTPTSGGPLTLLASATTVRLVAGADEIARHARSYDTGQTIEDLAHLEGLLAATRQANPSTGRDRLRLAVPAHRHALRAARGARRVAPRAHGPAARPARRLRARRNSPPPSPRALERDALGADAIAHLLETQRRQRRQKPADPARACPTDPASAISTVTPHALESYDALARSDPDDPE